MRLDPDIAFQQKLVRWSQYLALSALVIGMLVLVGWQFNIDVFKQPLSGLKAMSPLAAVGFACSTLSFIFLTGKNTNNQRRITGYVLAVIVLLIGTIKMLSVLGIYDSGIDTILFRRKMEISNNGENSHLIVPSSAVNFIFTGISLLLFSRTEERIKIVAQIFTTLTTCIALFSILGYLYSVKLFYGWFTYLPMAIHSSVCFLLLSLAALFAFPGTGIMREIGSVYAGSQMGRRLIPAAIFIPMLLGFLRLMGHKAGIFTTEFGVSILVLSIILIFLGIIWYNAALLNKRDQKAAEAVEISRQNEKQIQTIFSAAPDAVIVIDQEGKITKWNSMAEIIFGWQETEVMTRRLSEIIIPERYREAHEKGVKHFLATGDGPALGRSIEIQALRKDNTEFDVALTISPTMVGGKYIFIGFIRDITEKKLMETQIREANINLEKRIQERTSELEMKNKELEQFAYVASHDLQEPLRTTSSFIELFKEKYQGQLDEEADTMLGFITQASERMKILIADLLDYSRIGRKIVIQDVNLNRLLEDVLDDLSTFIQETNADIRILPMPVIRGYQTEIKQLFQNLIMNAIKFRKKGMAPVIKIKPEKKPGFWQFSVSDNGIGIDEKHKERIFIIFQRLHTRDEYEGSGIGLSHCKKIAELHGGKIWVESVPGEGSTFYFTIREM